MKRFVETGWGAGLLGGVFAAAVVVLTGASAGATYLIAFGVLLIVLGFLLGPDRIRLWREEHRSPTQRDRSPR